MFGNKGAGLGKTEPSNQEGGKSARLGGEADQFEKKKSRAEHWNVRGRNRNDSRWN